MLARLTLGAMAFLAAALNAPVSYAESLTFYVRSEHPRVISLEFYSEDREHSWPGGNEVYVVDDRETREYVLSCRRGEKVCLGAWVRGKSQEFWASARIVGARAARAVSSATAATPEPRSSIASFDL